MNRVSSVVLLFAGLLIFGLILNGTLARDIAVIIAGFAAAVVIAVVIAGGLCLLAQCAPRVIALRLLRFSPRTQNKASSRVTSGDDLTGQARVHPTKGKHV